MSLALCTLTAWYGMTIRSWSSFKCLKNGEDMKETLQFWTCFALLQIFDCYFEMFVSWIPLYAVAKFVLLWYIITPSTHGSQVVFENFIEPKIFGEKIFEKFFVQNVLQQNFLDLHAIWDQVTELLVSQQEVDLQRLRDRMERALERVDEEMIHRRQQQQHHVPQRLDDYNNWTTTTTTTMRVTRSPSPVDMPTPGLLVGFPSSRQASAVSSPPLFSVRSPQTPSSAVTSSHTASSAVKSNQTPSSSATVKSSRQQYTPPVAGSMPNSTTKWSSPSHPSYFPTRGVQVHQDEEDSQDATLRVIELDEESPPLSSSEDSPVLAETQREEERFSWMSPRWPIFSWASPAVKNNEADSIFDISSSSSEEEEEGSTLRHHQQRSTTSALNTGPITRSRANGQQGMSQAQQWQNNRKRNTKKKM